MIEHSLCLYDLQDLHVCVYISCKAEIRVQTASALDILVCEHLWSNVPIYTPVVTFVG
jgi:hypothetical protein